MGRSANESGWAGYPDYALGIIWREPWFVQLDTANRRTLSCRLFFGLCNNDSQTAYILFDDYKPRPKYHAVKRIAQPQQRIGRMVIFRIVPGMVSARVALELAPYLYDPA